MALSFVGSTAILALLYYLRDILIPFVIAFVLVVLVEALVAGIRRRLPVAPAWLVAWTAGIVVIGAASVGIFVFAQGLVQMAGQAPAMLDRIDQLVASAANALGVAAPPHVRSLAARVDTAQIARTMVSEVQGVGGTVVLIIIYFGFMLAGRRRTARKFELIAGTSSNWPHKLVERAAADIRTYLWVQTIHGAMVTAAATAVMLAVGLHNVLFWSVAFFLLSFIPELGVTVGSIAPALFALLQFPTVWQAIAIFAVIQVTAFFVGTVVYPRLQARAQNIDPITTIVALSFWTFLWGITGAFLAVPLTLMMMMIFAQFDSTRWISAALSNDGNPDFRKSV